MNYEAHLPLNHNSPLIRPYKLFQHIVNMKAQTLYNDLIEDEKTEFLFYFSTSNKFGSH